MGEKHSPLPWRYEADALALRIRDASGESVTYDDGRNGEGHWESAPDAEDMAFIVECVNQHHELLARVADQERLIDDLCRDHGRVPQDATPTERVRAENERLREALARILALYAKTDGWKEAYAMAEAAKAALDGER